MSQILTVQLDLSLQELQSALAQRGIEVQQSRGRRLLLPVSAECIAEPVDLLCQAGSADTIEAWGFREQEGQVHLVCGQFDQTVLQEGLLDPIRRSIALERVQKALQEVDEELQSEQQPAEIVVKPSSTS